jgi:phosphoketolase
MRVCGTTCRRTGSSLDVSACKGAGKITTSFDTTAIRDLKCVHPVMDAMARLLLASGKGIYLKLRAKDKQLGSNQYIDRYRERLAETRSGQREINKR